MANILTPTPRLDGPGTREDRWRAWPGLDALTRWIPGRPATGRAVVVAPHPDDEVLGPGGTVSLLTRAGTDVVIVAVTDGEASHPGRDEDLRRLRPAESAAALARLEIVPQTTHRLTHPDGDVDEVRLAAQLSDVVRPGDLLLAPWYRDGHPDHDRVGRAALAAGRRCHARLMAYLVWTWHWAAPGDTLPWSRADRVDLGPRLTHRKRRAIECFTSQIAGPDPILPAPVLARLSRSFEVFIRP